MSAPQPGRLSDLQRAMRLISEAVDDLPAECRDLAANALLNLAAETVVQDVGCPKAGRIFARLADFQRTDHAAHVTMVDARRRQRVQCREARMEGR